MENISEHGATLLGQRLGAWANGICIASLALFFDWITPSWCKIAYVVVEHLFRARGADISLVGSKTSWQHRKGSVADELCHSVVMFSSWVSMCLAYLVWAPNRRLIMIYLGLTGRSANLVLWYWFAMKNDGLRNMIDKIYDNFFDTTFSFLISSYILTHRSLAWGLIKWSFVRLVLPLLCFSVPLYYFREHLRFSGTYRRILALIFLLLYRSWDLFDYMEAQVVERLPRYLQHRWSSYQQSLPARASLPKYQYQSLNTGEIRLLTLKKSPFYPSVIQAEIIHRPVYPPPDYEAVSYRWGSSELTDEIIVSGYRFPVTKAAFDLLLARRSVWTHRTLWIDAICINQEDIQEKSEQVQLMRDIYHRASRVVAYPGGDWQSRIAGSTIYQLWGLAHQYNTNEIDYTTISNEASALRWRAMADLFGNTYFSRTWVIQEIAVGQNTQLYIGGEYIPWAIFAEVLDWCFQPNRRHLLTGSDEKDRRTWRSGQTIENIFIMSFLRPEAETGTFASGKLRHMLDLENLLFITSSFRSADPRDKVFGLVGIARNAGDLALITPDYSLPVEQVFQNAAQAIFSLPRERRTIHILALAGTGFGERATKMPSWVPNFNKQRVFNSYSNILYEEGRFKASGDLPQHLELDYRYNSILFKGITIDRVLDISEYGALDWGLQESELTDPFKVIAIQREYVYAAVSLCEKHTGSSKVSDQRTYERLWWALITGRINKKPADAKFRKVFQHWLSNLDLMHSSQSYSRYEQRVKEGALGEGAVFVHDGTQTAYHHSFMEACFSRRVAITAAGRLCIVPPLTKVGDSVIIPFGSQTPFLTRKHPEQSHNISYELIGEAWVDGVMYGETISDADEELIRIS
ncbi:HET-domain-containing protein [Xylaria venustula]|nr:HET-domain-containing protein [Xylaria venustula]